MLMFRVCDALGRVGAAFASICGYQASLSLTIVSSSEAGVFAAASRLLLAYCQHACLWYHSTGHLSRVLLGIYKISTTMHVKLIIIILKADHI